MTTTLRAVELPDFGTPLERPNIPAETYAERCDEMLRRAGTEWVAVYADREHFANMSFLTGFEPRFEEAILLLGPNGERLVVTGNENQDYTAISTLPGLETVLCQSLSLMGQDRSVKPSLKAVLGEVGISRGATVGLAGWKYLETEEWSEPAPSFFVPAYVVDTLRVAVGAGGDVSDVTPVLMHPQNGLRAVVGADQIAEAEWAAVRASLAVWRIVQGYRLGDSELLAASRMGYAGEPMNCHPMLASSSGDAPVIGLRSPTARVPERGDGVTTAVSYWGGLSARAGLIDDANDEFLEIAKAYFAGLIAWYEIADIGVEGGAIHEAVVAKLASGNLRSALNPGHLTGHDEWMHSPIRPCSSERIVSGMPFQIDIIPVPLKRGWALNCEDPVTFADTALKTSLKERHPDVAARCDARSAFVTEEIGVDLKDSMLLLSATPLCLAPFWLKSDHILTRA